MQDDRTRQQISVLEGFPTVRDLLATGVNVINLTDNIFRTEKLSDKINLPTPTSATTTAPASAPPVQQTAVSTPATSIASVSPTPVTTASYANIMASASPPPQLNFPLTPKPALNRQKTAPAPWKPGPRGLDDAITASPQAVENIKKRRENNKLCNNHYLRGPCAKGDACCFVHNYKPTSDEINAIALLSRLNPCTAGQDCDVEDCIYGHHVSFTVL